MKTVLINPSSYTKGLNDASVLPPLGLAYIAAVLETKGHRVEIIDGQALRLNTEGIVSRISHEAKLIGLYVNSFVAEQGREICQICRFKFPGMTIILGGPLPTSSPENCLENIPCDGLVRGEGEFSLLKVADNIASGREPFSGSVPGAVYYGQNGKLMSLRPRRLTSEELNALPFPAYHLLPDLHCYKAYQRQSPAAAIITTRGCVHQCSFCSKDVFERKVTIRSAENVLEEIEWLVSKYKIRHLDILDDNFVVDKKRLEEILDGLIVRGYKITINPQAGIRTEGMTRKLLVKMKKAGFYKLPFGIESADQKVLELMNKRLDIKKAANIIQAAKGLGFLVWGFFIIGMPGETEEAFDKTIKFARKIDFDAAVFTIAMPLPGTDLYRTVEKEGRFLIDTSFSVPVGLFSGQAFYELGALKAKDVERRYRTAYKEFYSIRKKIKLLLRIRSWHELKVLLDAGRFIMKSLILKRD